MRLECGRQESREETFGCPKRSYDVREVDAADLVWWKVWQ